MPEPATKLRERLDLLEADLQAARDREDALRQSAAEAQAEGEEASEHLAALREVRAERESMEDALPLVREQLGRAEAAEARAKAERRVEELAVQARTRRENSASDAEAAASKIGKALALAESAWGAVDAVRLDGAEISMLAELFDLDAPADVPSASEVLEDLDGLRTALNEARQHLTVMARKYPRDARSGAPGIQAQRRLRDLLTPPDEITRRSYSRSSVLRARISDAAWRVAGPAVVEQRRRQYESLRPEDRERVSPPRPVEDQEDAA